jgi:cytidylate kinase
VQPEDALVIDSTTMAADEVADIIVARVTEARV